MVKMSMKFVKIGVSIFVLLLMIPPELVSGPGLSKDVDIEESIAYLRTYDYGESRKPLIQIETLINEIHGNDRRSHFDADTSKHAHFICSGCDQIIDVRGVKSIDWRTMKDLVGCEVEDQTVVFTGRCPGCRQDAKKA